MIRVPATSANLGPGFDALGLAVTCYADVGLVGSADQPDDAEVCGARHPAHIAFIRAGGAGDIWVRNSIPMGRGMGFSGAVRVGGILAAFSQRSEEIDRHALMQAVEIGTELEGHADNVAASAMGGIIATSGGVVVRVPSPLRPAVVMWVPSFTTSTNESRSTLPASVSFADAVFNVGRTAVLVAAFAAGDISALRTATEDRLHQDRRLENAPASRAALTAGLAANAWCGWLSGSGPTVALLCDAAEAEGLSQRLPAEGHVKVLELDTHGAHRI
ncbi:MAG: homoserine kinase [Ilumatobacteraceae bacterium]|jgi:homoserine kinase|nr:homoserine kinase [Ilumatobacteraceae bacterium]